MIELELEFLTNTLNNIKNMEDSEEKEFLVQQYESKIEELNGRLAERSNAAGC